MSLEERFHAAIRRTDKVGGLRSLAIELFSEGYDGADIVRLFEAFRLDLAKAGRGVEEDAVLDVMDFLEGWCSPHMKLPKQG